MLLPLKLAPYYDHLCYLSESSSPKPCTEVGAPVQFVVWSPDPEIELAKGELGCHTPREGAYRAAK